MKNIPLEKFVEKSYNLIKKAVGSSRAKKVSSVVIGGLAYFGLGNQANAQVTSIIDSLRFSVGYAPENRGPNLINKFLWQKNTDGTVEIPETLDVGILYTDAPPYILPASIPANPDFEVNFNDSEWVTKVITGKIYRAPENTPIEGAGVNIFDARTRDFLGGNYVEGSQTGTDANGRFQKVLYIKVQKAPESIDSVVTVLFPNGGEDLVGGSTQEVSLNNNYSGNDFKLSFSIDNGNTWNVMANGIESTYNWKIPNDVSSDDCLVKVADGKNSNVYDISDGVFSITPESIDSVVTVLFPNNGEQLLGASEQEISWENNYDGNNFKVSFSTDNGKNWEYIDNGTEFKNGSSSVMKYDWKIPNDITSDSCLVKVEDDKNSKVYDISDKVFSVDIDTYVESTVLEDGVPKKFSVGQNYPNPFNPSTTIQYQLAEPAENVKITIYDALCRKVEEFNEASKGPGIEFLQNKP